MDISKFLFENADEKYKEFQAKLMPTISKDKILGVRTPLLRKLAKDICKTEEAEKFIGTLPHRYYEENNLHAFLIEQIQDINKSLYETEKFLPYIDTWATCDSMSPSAFRKNHEKVLIAAEKWILSNRTYTVRYGIGIFMKYFLDEKFNPEHLKKIADIKSDEYYINMMRAWYFATALSKQYDAVIPYFENRNLDAWTHKKAIQKSIESYRILPEIKEYLRKLK